MANLRVHLANCYVAGTRSPQAEREFIQFTVERLRLRYLQQPFEHATGANKPTQHTADLLVENVTTSKLKATRRAAEWVAWMLAFVSGSKVVPFGHEYPDGSGNRSRQPVSELGQVFRPALPGGDRRALVAFLEACYDNYKRLERARKLNVVVDYLLLSDAPEQPIEVRLLLGLVLPEGLKATYIAGVPNRRRLSFPLTLARHRLSKTFGTGLVSPLRAPLSARGGRSGRSSRRTSGRSTHLLSCRSN